MPIDNREKITPAPKPLSLTDDDCGRDRRARLLLVHLLAICLVEMTEDFACSGTMATDSERETLPS